MNRLKLEASNPIVSDKNRRKAYPSEIKTVIELTGNSSTGQQNNTLTNEYQEQTQNEENKRILCFDIWSIQSHFLFELPAVLEMVLFS